jgi:diguanylate cyclase (GGDEF)-like protein
VPFYQFFDIANIGLKGWARMHVFSWLDNRTLIACDLMLAIAFAIVFFGMKRTYPKLRGINTIAISFLLFVPGTTLVASRGFIPHFLSITIANFCVFGSFIFLYRGILRFIGTRRTIVLPVVISCLSAAVLFYYSQVQDRVAPRIVAISLTVGAIRGLIALELFRKSPQSPSPKAMRLFAASMSLFAAVTVNCGIATWLGGATLQGLQGSDVGSFTLLLSVVSIFVTGIFVLLLSSGELIAASRDESLRDALSGAFNRRGIEVKLAAELKRISTGKHKLSVALIDVDYFKSINDIEGHAAGDNALRKLADTINSQLRGRDLLGRYGGDEFLLLLPMTPCSIALGVTERLCNAVTSLPTSIGSIPLTLSIGLTEATPEDDAATLIARADKALYRAKSDGRNCRRVVTAGTEAISVTEAAPSLSLHDRLIPVTESSSARL